MSKEKLAKKAESVRKEKTEAYENLKNFKDFTLKRDVFFIHGWGDEANICWTEPYTEVGKYRDPNWKYTIKEWLEEKIENTEKIHFPKLVADESKVKIVDKRGHTEIELDYRDRTHYYICFYQFTELLKEKIRQNCGSNSCDLVCHSMGGLDAVAAIALDMEDDETGFITSPCLEGVNKLVTVATPHKGSPKGEMANSILAKIVFNSSIYVTAQGVNMSPEREFIRQINTSKTRQNLLSRINELYEFTGGNDPVVPHEYGLINTDGISTDKIVVHEPFMLAEHSQKMGITQDPRLILEVMKILSN